MLFSPFTFLRGGTRLYIRTPLCYYNPQPIISPTHRNELSHISTTTQRKHFCTSERLYKFVPDKSKVPTLSERDLEEQFVQGSGPGGQNVNRLQNCVVLRHIPTGIVVKCHQDRLLQRNRKIARQLLLDQLDQHYNGPDSVAEQKKQYIVSRLVYREQKAADLRSLKKQYRESLKQVQSSSSNPLDSNSNNSSSSTSSETEIKNS